MAKKIKSRLKQLRLDEASRRGDTLSIREVHRMTGIAISTLRHLEEGSVQGVDFTTVLKLMDFYKVARLDDMFEVTEEDRLTRDTTGSQPYIASRALATH